MAVEKNLRVATNFYKKLCIPVITRNEKHLSKQVAALIHTLGKFFFLELLLLEGCELFLFRQSEKLAVYFGLWEFYLDVQSREDQINTVYGRTNFLLVTRYFLLVTRYFLLVPRYYFLVNFY